MTKRTKPAKRIDPATRHRQLSEMVKEALLIVIEAAVELQRQGIVDPGFDQAATIAKATLVAFGSTSPLLGRVYSAAKLALAEMDDARGRPILPHADAGNHDGMIIRQHQPGHVFATDQELERAILDRALQRVLKGVTCKDLATSLAQMLSVAPYRVKVTNMQKLADAIERHAKVNAKRYVIADRAALATLLTKGMRAAGIDKKRRPKPFGATKRQG